MLLIIFLYSVTSIVQEVYKATKTLGTTATQTAMHCKWPVKAVCIKDSQCYMYARVTIDMSYLLHFVHDFVDIDTPVVCFLLVVTIPTLKMNQANVTDWIQFKTKRSNSICAGILTDTASNSQSHSQSQSVIITTIKQQ